MCIEGRLQVEILYYTILYTGIKLNQMKRNYSRKHILIQYQIEFNSIESPSRNI